MTALPQLESDLFSQYLAFAHRLADLSGSAILPVFRNTGAIDDKAERGALDPVTAADRAAEEVIRAAITEAWPEHGVRGEEFGSVSAEAEFCWVIDPIDGTRAFIMGLPVWGTLIGLTHRGVPLLGVMNQPFIGERYWSDLDGARVRGPAGESRIATRPCTSLADALLAATSPDMFAAGVEQDRFEALVNQVRLRRFGTDCYGFCQLAAGHIDLVVEAGLHAFDIAPLIPIVERAGGCVTSWSGGPAGEGGRVVASGDPRLHEAALEVLQG